MTEQHVELEPGLTVVTGAATAGCARTLPHACSALLSDMIPSSPAPLTPACAGESGSGKSVLVEALGQLLGAAAFDEAVRPPSDTAVLQGVVVVAPPQQAPLRRLLQELGVPQRASRDLGRLVLRRELVKGVRGGGCTGAGLLKGSEGSFKQKLRTATVSSLPLGHI